MQKHAKRGVPAGTRVFRTGHYKCQKTIKNDEELKSDLDEEFGEIGDPIEARINLAITYIEMNQIDKANDLLSQVLESEATESQKEKARNLIKDIQFYEKICSQY